MAYLLGPCEMGVDVAEQIRKRVESHPFSVSTADPSQTTYITISGGVASFPTDGSTALELIQRADQALYRAKLSGRNQTCVYDPNLDKPHRNQQGADAFAIIQGPADAQ
jgi:diguanylate cyclase